MNIMITGGAGFIGSNIADKFIEEGHKVIIIDNLSTGYEENINKDAKFYNINICDKGINKIIKDEKIDCINHHAAQIDVRVSVKDPEFDCMVNIQGSINLLQSAIKNNVKKFIFASSGGAIYGEQIEFPASDDHPTRPISPYGITKLSVEKYLYYYHLIHNLDFAALRYANVYGPRQNSHGEAGVIAIFINKLLKGEQPVINGDGSQTRDYTYVGDIVTANLIALNNTLNTTYNIGTGFETSVTELFNKIVKALSLSTKAKYIEAKKGEQLRSVLSTLKITKNFQWEPKIGIEEGLKKTIHYFKNNL